MKESRGPLPSQEQLRGMVALGGDPKLQAAVSSLANAPDEWARAMADPRAWLQSRGIQVPDGLNVEFVNDVSTPKPLPPGGLGKPEPDWVPFTIRQYNCRTYWLPRKDDKGNIAGYQEVNVCFGFRIVPTPIPGGPRG